MLNQAKKRFSVSIIHSQTYDGFRVQEWEENIGTTYAVSEKQAINNVRHRNGIRSSDMECFGRGYTRTSRFVARQI